MVEKSLDSVILFYDSFSQLQSVEKPSSFCQLRFKDCNRDWLLKELFKNHASTDIKFMKGIPKATTTSPMKVPTAIIRRGSKNFSIAWRTKSTLLS